MITESDVPKVREVRQYLKTITGFKSVQITEREKNLGLAQSVITGVTEVIEKFGKVIVLEDDVICSTYCLEFINTALEKYKKETNVMMVSGYNFPINSVRPKQTCFFLPQSSSQVWATWLDAWKKLDINAKNYEIVKQDKKTKKRFDLDNSYPFSEMLIKQMESDETDSWAIRWNWTIFKNNGLVLYPDKSLIKNTGWDGSGIHSSKSNPFYDEYWKIDYRIINYPAKVKITKQQYTRTKKYFKSVLKSDFSGLKEALSLFEATAL